MNTSARSLWPSLVLEFAIITEYLIIILIITMTFQFQNCYTRNALAVYNALRVNKIWATVDL